MSFFLGVLGTIASHIKPIQNALVGIQSFILKVSYYFEKIETLI